MKHKKLASLVLACAMVLGLAGITPVQAANTTSTTVSLTVASAPYTITIPTALTVSKTGWNPIDTGIKAEGSSFPENSKLTVSATSQHSWNLYLDATHQIGYTLKAAESDTSATTSWEFTSTEVRSGKTVTAGIAVNDYSNAAPGTYQDVVTFTATVTDLTVPVTGVTLNKTSTTLTVGGDETLTATVAPADATNKAVTWASDNTSVATVDSNGKVTAVAAGTANITATSSADSTKSASCAVTVNAATTTRTVTFNTATDGKTINKDGVTCSDSFDNYNDLFGRGSGFSVSSGQFTKIEVTASGTSMIGRNRSTRADIEGWSTDYDSATWTGKSSTVPFGVIMGNSNPVTIVFTIEDTAVAVTGVTLDKTTATLTVGGGTETLTATVKPDNATDKTVTWTSSNENVATVANGVVTPVAAGSATITAKAGDKTATCAVTVNAPATYTVSFDANGGTGTMADVTGVSGSYTLPACTFTAPDGKEFDKWQVSGNTYDAGQSITVSANTTVTATWKDSAVKFTVKRVGKAKMVGIISTGSILSSAVRLGSSLLTAVKPRIA